jgi:hypothetical protein
VQEETARNDKLILGSSVTRVTRIGAGRLGFDSRQDRKTFVFSLCHRVQTGSGAHTASYAMGSECFYLGIKATGEGH